MVTLSQLSKQARELKANIARNIYELGRVLAQILDGDRYEEMGYRSFTAYVEHELDLSGSTAYRAIVVYRHFSAAIARRYGVSKLEAGLAYMRATPVRERPGDLIAASIRVRGETGRFVRKRFHDASVREIREATKLVRAENRGRDISARLRKSTQRLAKRLPPAPSRFVRGTRIRLHRDDKSGRLFASFAAIPLDALDDYIELLRELRGALEQ